MEENNMALREKLEQLSTERLDEMLNAELRKQAPDTDLIRMILQVLRQREKDVRTEITPGMQAAWEDYVRGCAEDDKYFAAQRAAKKCGWVIRAAAIAAVVALLIFTIPPAMGAGNAVEIIRRWAEDVITFFAPTEPEDTQSEYIFRTDNPGLRQVYDEVVKLGVTAPVVPMRLPAGYELIELKITNYPTKIRVYARFANGAEKIVFIIDVFGVEAIPAYERDKADSVNVELAGIDHEITSNDGGWVAVWERENVQCSLTVDGQETMLYAMLRSVYMTEE